MNFLFRLLLSFNSTSLLLIIFAAQKGYTLDYFFSSFEFLARSSDLVSYFIYVLFPAVLTGVSVLLSSKLGVDEFSPGEIVAIEHASNSFLPSYLGYFFVALSVHDVDVLIFVYGVVFVFTFLSQAIYFNPLFLLYGFNFYNIKTGGGVSIFLISKNGYRKPGDVIMRKAYRINNYTFIEWGD